MRVTSWSAEERTELAGLLRIGEPVHLHIDTMDGRGHRMTRNLRMDEIVPLVDSISVDDAALARAAREFAAPAGISGSAASVTAVIPCSRTAPIGMRSLLSQDVELDVLILSNGAGPKSVEGARVERVPWRGHGATRADAVQRVDTDYVFFTVDDAIPLGRGCIRTLVEALETGPWDAVVARQIPWPDADAVTASRLRRWTPPGHRVVPMEQTDHVGTLIRTDTLRRYPIPAVPIAEDAWWSMDRRVGYVPMAPVLHSHDRDPVGLYKRNRDIHAQLVAMGRPASVPTLAAAAAALPGVIRPTLAGGGRELLNQFAEIAGQWRGAFIGR